MPPEATRDLDSMPEVGHRLALVAGFDRTVVGDALVREIRSRPVEGDTIRVLAAAIDALERHKR